MKGDTEAMRCRAFGLIDELRRRLEEEATVVSLPYDSTKILSYNESGYLGFPEESPELKLESQESVQVSFEIGGLTVSISK